MRFRSFPFVRFGTFSFCYLLWPFVCPFCCASQDPRMKFVDFLSEPIWLFQVGHPGKYYNFRAMRDYRKKDSRAHKLSVFHTFMFAFSVHYVCGCGPPVQPILFSEVTNKLCTTCRTSHARRSGRSDVLSPGAAGSQLLHRGLIPAEVKFLT